MKASFGFLKSVVRHRAEPIKNVSINTLISILMFMSITFTVQHNFFGVSLIVNYKSFIFILSFCIVVSYTIVLFVG